MSTSLPSDELAEKFKTEVESESIRLLQYIEASSSDVLVMTMALHSVYIGLLHLLQETNIPYKKLIPLLTALKIGDDERLATLARWVGEEISKVEAEGRLAGIG